MAVWLTSMFLLSGFMISFLISLYGRKWELTRFLIPGCIFGMISLLLGFRHLVEFTSRKGNILLVLLAAFITFGPVVDYLMILAGNTHGEWRVIVDKLILMTHLRGIIQ